MRAVQINKFALSMVRIFLLCFMFSTTGISQEVWRAIPTTQPGPDESNLRGVVVDAVSIINGKQTDARVVISGKPKTGLFTLAFWVRDLFDMIPEREFWPYMGPDGGKESLNPNMIDIILFNKNEKRKWEFTMMVTNDGNFPKGVTPKKNAIKYEILEYLLRAGTGYDSKIISNMTLGFDYGIATIGRGVFKHPIEIKFSGKGIEQPLKEVMDVVGKPVSKPSRPRKASPRTSPR